MPAYNSTVLTSLIGASSPGVPLTRTPQLPPCVDGIARVVNGLAPTSAGIVFIPAVAGHALVLLACVAEV